MSKRPLFTDEELKAMRLADEEIEKSFSMTPEDWERSKELDKQSRLDRLDNRGRKIAAQQAAYREANREKIAAQQAAYYEANREKIAAQQAAYREANREKIAAQQAAYREANREKIAAQKAAYREANREKIAAQQAAYYEANREKIAAQQAAYYEANREKWNAYQRDYRRRKRLLALQEEKESRPRNSSPETATQECPHTPSITNLGENVNEIRL